MVEGVIVVEQVDLTIAMVPVTRIRWGKSATNLYGI